MHMLKAFSVMFVMQHKNEKKMHTNIIVRKILYIELTAQPVNRNVCQI